MPPKPRNSDDLLLEIFQGLANVQADVKLLLLDRTAAEQHRKDYDQKIERMRMDVALLSQTVVGMAPTVEQLKTSKATQDGALSAGKHVWIFLSGSVGGALASFFSWWITTPKPH